ncbi:hypothetical protein GCM10023190_13710 [Enteractinococcus fodinae]|uniref:Beta-lactamase class A n=1 Tax=Enteractinococcus fodinae TaxID=684663 RepID=A0ABU2AXT5_9MICC|nr:serine hydrolase [Enteractinococcus fodinae]MDR7346153.1 beta-lactamase class A [Enteractinococcus fodinae]
MSEPLLDRAADEPAPLGSMFKLYVLYAVAQAIEAGELSWDTVLTVSEHNRSLPSGELQDEPAGTTVTVHDAATKMIQISDNTATDMLIQQLGREAIEAAVRDAGHHDPELMAPFPSTREFFQIGWSDPAYLETWSDGTKEEQRDLLDELEQQPIDEYDVAVGGDPVWPQGVEWFASAEDVAAVHRALHEHPDPTIRTILGGQSGAEQEKWDYVAFKGGSSPGVLTGSWFIENGPGEQYVVVLQAATDDPAGISATTQREFFDLADATLELATN